MDTPLPPTSALSTRRPSPTTHVMQIVIGAAFVVATVFTWWIPSGYLPAAPPEPTYLVPDWTEQAQVAAPTVEPRIGIVAGHWSKDPAYYDPGAVCPEALGGLREVDVNYGVASRLQQALAQMGYTVDLLAEFDEKLLNYRAMALVSIHADSCDYIEGEPSGFKVAAPISNPNPANSKLLVSCIENRYQQVTQMELHPGSVTRDMTQYHAFGEIDPLTPAAIIEVGFLNRDNEILTKKQDLLAQGVLEGILCFLRGEAVNQSVTPTPTP